MTRVEFDQLVEGLESKFKGRKDALTRSSMLWALFGYVVLSIAIVCSLALLLGCIFFIVLHPNVVTIKFGGILGIAAGALTLTLVRSLWNRLRPPEGREITRDEAPALFGMIDDISEAAGGVRFHKVLLTNDLNASVVQLPLAGIFGMHRNYLSLGLPLMDALEPEEFKAVLAHEFSHLSSRDGSTGNWIYRIRMTWERAAYGIFQKEGFLIAPLKKFFVWFWPRFNARAFVLSRSNEYQADAFAAKVTSPATSARALQRVDLRARHLEDVFWKEINLRVVDEPQPPSAIFGEMKDFLRADPEPTAASRWLSHAFSLSTGTSDTHPSLGDRVRALGMPVDSRMLPTLREHASDALLGVDFSTRAREVFSGEWHQLVLENWQSSHKSRAELRGKLEELPSTTEGGDSGETGWQRIILRLETEGIDSVFPALRDYAVRHPDHKAASFLTAQYLLEHDDPSGLRIMERLAEHPPDTLECLGAMAAYHDRQGNHDAVNEMKRRADLHDDQMESAVQARNNLTKHDTFLPHGLDEQKIGEICDLLAGEKSVRSAWLVRKHHRELENWKHFVMAVDLSFPWYRFTSDNDTRNVLQRLADGLDLDGYILVIRNEKENKPIYKQIRIQQPDSVIHTVR